MTHHVHPYAHRLGIIRDWKSRWFGVDGKYQEFLKTDIMLREYLKKRLRKFYIDGVEMERGQNLYRIIIKTSRPGMVIGRNGEEQASLKKDIEKKIQKLGVEIPKELRVDIEEVKDPEIRSAIVAYSIAEGLERRLPFRRVLKQAIEKTMANKKALGIKIVVSGRLGGAEMGRRESIKKGRIPLQTLRADIDFSREKAYLPYGVIGIKVWIYRGDIFDDK